MNTKRIIAIALHDEAHRGFDGENVIYTGCGKINAAYHLTKSIIQQGAKEVINLGSAGSAHFPTGSLVNCTRFMQRDMNASALGLPLGQTPFDELGIVLEHGQRLPQLPEATCGTGDNFATDCAVGDYQVVDMEAYSLARVCQLESIPFTCVKYITDGADEQAGKDWESTVATSAQHLFEFYNNYFC